MNEEMSPQTADAFVTMLLKRLNPEIRDAALSSLTPTERQGIADAAKRDHRRHQYCELGQPCNS